MAGEIIRLGDSTSHGGIVLEGSAFDICMGKPIAYIGHKVQCPKCKGAFPIIEGALTTTFYGKGVALAGMRTSCGAILIASQFTDVVEYGGGAAASNKRSETPESVIAAADAAKGKRDSAVPEQPKNAGFDDKFILVDEVTGDPIAYTEYAIRRESGGVEHGTTDADGHTHLLSSTAKAERIEIYV
jgi:uncharacterized Zn-binding protein involved in type VI secretion